MVAASLCIIIDRRLWSLKEEKDRNKTTQLSTVEINLDVKPSEDTTISENNGNHEDTGNETSAMLKNDP